MIISLAILLVAGAMVACNHPAKGYTFKTMFDVIEPETAAEYPPKKNRRAIGTIPTARFSIRRLAIRAIR